MNLIGKYIPEFLEKEVKFQICEHANRTQL